MGTRGPKVPNRLIFPSQPCFPHPPFSLSLPWPHSARLRLLAYVLELPGNVVPRCRHVRPGRGYVPNFQLFEKGDVNGEKEQKVFTFLKVSESLSQTSSSLAFLAQSWCGGNGPKAHAWKWPWVLGKRAPRSHRDCGLICQYVWDSGFRDGGGCGEWSCFRGPPLFAY